MAEKDTTMETTTTTTTTTTKATEEAQRSTRAQQLTEAYERDEALARELRVAKRAERERDAKGGAVIIYPGWTTRTVEANERAIEAAIGGEPERMRKKDKKLGARLFDVYGTLGDEDDDRLEDEGGINVNSAGLHIAEALGVHQWELFGIKFLGPFAVTRIGMKPLDGEEIAAIKKCVEDMRYSGRLERNLRTLKKKLFYS